jgi:hypothetical protein
MLDDKRDYEERDEPEDEHNEGHHDVSNTLDHTISSRD